MIQDKIKKHLQVIYGEKITADQIWKIIQLVDKNQNSNKGPIIKWDESDVVLITYADSIKSTDKTPLQTLHFFLDEHLHDQISCVHLLPFYPYSSDDGFSVIDYRQVNPEVGSWGDISSLATSFQLMFDYVVNHCSSKSEWFKNFIKGEGNGANFFIVEDPTKDLSKVVRPRTSPLLTAYETPHGTKHVWTTFSADQVDLNFANPDLLIEMLDILVSYIKKGARILRMDAIAFLWKEPGTSCLHLPQTHEMVKLFRTVAEEVNPNSIILTETNVPNKENLSYFGNGDEAHMVYQFSLPPLLLYTLYTGDAQYLNSWAQTIPDLPSGQTFFNFTASHDGIGVRPVEGLVPVEKFKVILNAMQQQGGHVSSKTNSDGTTSPYEINISLIEAFYSDIDSRSDLQFERFICSQLVMLSMRGIPAPYIHSILATENYHEGVGKTGRARTINRRKWDLDMLNYVLQDSSSLQSKVFHEMKRILSIRRKLKAFHPDAKQEILNISDDFFMVKRNNKVGDIIYSLSNITNKELELDLQNNLPDFNMKYCCDALSGSKIDIGKTLTFNAYQTYWLIDC